VPSQIAEQDDDAYNAEIGERMFCHPLSLR
jgi:hypothetical protein